MFLITELIVSTYTMLLCQVRVYTHYTTETMLILNGYSTVGYPGKVFCSGVAAGFL